METWRVPASGVGHPSLQGLQVKPRPSDDYGNCTCHSRGDLNCPLKVFCAIADGTELPITDDGRSQQGGALEAQGEPSSTSIVKEGYLNKQPSNGIRRAWQRRFFKLDSAGNFYYENGEGGSFRVNSSSHLFRESLFAVHPMCPMKSSLGICSAISVCYITGATHQPALLRQNTQLYMLV